jgi:hypothetical protein
MFSLHSPEDLLKLHGEVESLQRDFHRYQVILGGQNHLEEPALRSALMQRFMSIEDELNRLGVVRVSMIDGRSRHVFETALSFQSDPAKRSATNVAIEELDKALGRLRKSLQVKVPIASDPAPMAKPRRSSLSIAITAGSICVVFSALFVNLATEHGMGGIYERPYESAALVVAAVVAGVLSAVFARRAN